MQPERGLPRRHRLGPELGCALRAEHALRCIRRPACRARDLARLERHWLRARGRRGRRKRDGRGNGSRLAVERRPATAAVPVIRVVREAALRTRHSGSAPGHRRGRRRRDRRRRGGFGVGSKRAPAASAERVVRAVEEATRRAGRQLRRRTCTGTRCAPRVAGCPGGWIRRIGRRRLGRSIHRRPTIAAGPGVGLAVRSGPNLRPARG